MSMVDLGNKYDGEQPTIVGADEDKIHYPALHLNEKVPEELMGKDIGEMCRIEVIAKIVSKSIDKSMIIEIQKMDYKGKAGKLTKEEYLSKPKEEREKYDKEDLKIDEKE